MFRALTAPLGIWKTLFRKSIHRGHRCRQALIKNFFQNIVKYQYNKNLLEAAFTCFKQLFIAHIGP